MVYSPSTETRIATFNNDEELIMEKTFSTEELSEILKVKPSTIRRGLCVDGHYMGLVPKKMPNRRLLWSRGPVEKVLGGEEVKA